MKDVSDSTTPYDRSRHIQSYPWGVRHAMEVFRRKPGTQWAQREVLSVFADSEYARSYAKTNGAAVTSCYLVRCGSHWFRIANVHAVNLRWDKLDGSKVMPNDPSIYAEETPVLPYSRWRPVEGGEEYEVVKILTAKHMPPTGSRAALTQVVYRSVADPVEEHSHPLSRWHTSFIRIQPEEPNGGL